ncbi:RIP metalloprotease RseP [Bombella sp. TMW 2.2559]|uniref:Zinc metalloprotease n=1 Tax=Bombella dulcis TaxID=2967339 RepID=A0ABT3WB35_9PROT|nr:RIP metalloprotease RseP [Bombella dulcis]MCX5615495.1 RIP metalloprotease RseP [Bombella dulcis]
MHSLQSIIAGLVVFGIVVFIHELGHYLAARWRGVQVTVFSIGFGPALTSWKDRAGTRWQISLLPLGGYVKLHGFENRPDAPREEGDENAFNRKSVLSRAIVTVAGPVFNFLLTILLFVVLLSCFGRPEARPDIGTLAPDGAAMKAGLQVGDEIQRLNGHHILSIGDIQAQVAAHPGEVMKIGFLRKGQAGELPVTLDRIQQGGHDVGRLGVGFAVSHSAPLPVYKAVPAAIGQTWDMCGNMLEGIWQIITGQRSARQLSGTIGIIHMSGQAVDYGVASALGFVALLSLNLGLLNLFPVPMLDGGHLLFYACEAIRGRPLSERTQGYALQAGLFLVAALFIFSTVNDLRGLGVFHWLFAHGG